MPRFLCALTVVAAALLAGCGDTHDPGTGPITGLPRDLSVAEGSLIAADNAFAFELFNEINARQEEDNVFVSPLSVAMALGMTYNGASGTTREAMHAALGLKDLTEDDVNRSYRSLIDLLRGLDPRVEFILANSIWYRDTWTFEQAFLDICRQYFDAEISPLDFTAPAASDTINQWVRDATNNKIRDIVPKPVPWNVAMYLINAIYFQADWTYRFDESRTDDAPFTLADGAQTTVDMMSHDASIPIGYAERDGLQIVDVPYGGEAYAMTIVLPENPAAIHDVIGRLSQERWETWTAGLTATEVHLSMPKFALEYEIGLNDVLSSLGMAEAFDPAAADFTRMYAPGGIWIDSVVHKTFVDVNETGTEAAAATAVGMAFEGLPPTLIVDRPFVFVIRERLSGAILFMGRVLDPTAG
jgi:serine protease inhibitor